MKTKFFTTLLMTFAMSLIFFSASRAQVPSSYQCSIRNDSLTSSTVYEFDIYLQNTDLSHVFEFDLFQAGILVNPSIVNGGTITATIVSGSSQLVASQQPASLTFSAAQNCIKIGPGGVVPHGSATIISTTAPGTRIARIRLTNTVAFGQFAPNFSFNFTASPYNTAVFALDQTSPFLGVSIVNSADHTVLTMANPILNSPVTAFSMTGGGSDCTGSGIAVGLSGSQTGVLYRLLKNTIPVGAYVAGIGSALSFGPQTAGTYTSTAYRRATYLTGTMTGNVTVTEVTVLPTLSGLPTVCSGPTGIVYTTEAGKTNYVWNVSAGGTITAGGTSSSNTVTVAWNTAGAQTVSVNYTDGGCSAASPTVYPVTVNPSPLPTLTGIAMTCINSTGNVYTTEAGMNNYAWTVSTGGTITAGGTTTDNTITITWNSTGAQSVSVNYTNASGCSAHTATVYPVLVVSSYTPALSGLTSVCSDASGIVYLTDAGMSNYVWSITGGSITSGGTTTNDTAIVTWNTAGPQSISVTYTPSGGCSASITNLPVTVKELPVPVVDGTTSPCAGTSGVTYTTDAGMADYTWTISAGGTITAGAATNTITVTWNTAGPQTVSASYSSNGCMASAPTDYPVIVNPNLPVSVDIDESANSICAGTSVDFTATPTNGGSNPVYQWMVNGVNAGTNSPLFTYAPANNDIITCVLTSDAMCATGNPATSGSIDMTVNPILPVSVSIASSVNPACSGSSVTYTATAVNGGTAPFFQWLVNGVSAGTNSPTFTYVPLNNDIVSCVLTSNATCAINNPYTSNTIIMTVSSDLAAAVSISPSANTVCAGTPITFTATPTNGGSLPVYQWMVNGTNTGTNSPSFAYSPVNNDVVTCMMTSDYACASGSPATSNQLTMTVNTNMPVSVAIAASVNNVCSGTPVTFTATPTNGGSTPVYQWKVNGSNAGTNSTTYSYTPLNNDAVTCMMTSNATCTASNPATSNQVIMTVNANLPVSIAIAASTNPVCEATSVTFTATPTNGGTTPAYMWMVNGTTMGTDSPTFSYVPLNNDTVTCMLTSNETCTAGNPATSNQVIMTVNANLPVSVAIAASTNPVCDGASVTFTATPTNGGTAPVYMWMLNGTSVGTNSSIYSYIPANNDVVSCMMTSNASCVTVSTATSTPLTMTVNAIPAKPIITQGHDTLFSNAAAGNQWFTTTGMITGANSQIYVATADGIYWTMVTLNGCNSVNSDTINVVLTGINEISDNSTLEVYPSPNNGQFNVTISTAKEEHYDLLIYQAHGSLIYEEKDIVVKGQMDHKVNIDTYPAGIYYVILRDNNGQIMKRVVVEK